MDLTLSYIQSIFKGIEKKVFLFIMVLMISQVSILNTPLVLTLPILSIAFMTSYGTSLMYFLAIGIGVAFFDVSIWILIASLFTFLVLEIASCFYSFSVKYIPYLVALIGGICILGQTYVDGNINFYIPLFSAVIIFGLSEIDMKLVPLFHHEHYDYFTKEVMMVVAFLILSSLGNRFILNVSISLIIARFIILASMYIVDYSFALVLAVFLSFILLLQDLNNKDLVISLIIPFVSFFYFKPKRKIMYFNIYLLSHLILYFFISEGITYRFIEVGVAAFLFLLVQNKGYLFIRHQVLGLENIMSYEGGLISYRNKVSNKIRTFSDLFEKISVQFEEAEASPNVLSYIGNVYDHVCIDCVNKEHCFNKKEKEYQLGKHIKKSIFEKESKQDITAIKKFCLHSDKIFNEIKIQKNLYEESQRTSREYHLHKKNLYQQLSAVSNLLKDYSESIKNDYTVDDDVIRDVLEGYHFEVSYIKKDLISPDEYSLEIGLIGATKEEVYEIVIPIIQKMLDTTFVVDNLHQSSKQMGYTLLKLSNYRQYQMIYGLQQISKDYRFCGDTYSIFSHGNDTVVGISDGMGFGEKASVESKLTLDIFQRLLQSGIDLSSSIHTVNSLLKIKNRIEMFTTLDILLFNTRNCEAQFIKNGSMPSYIYRDRKLIYIDSQTLPIGIVNDVDVSRVTYQLEEDDLVVLFTDGFSENIEYYLDKILSINYDKNPQEIASKIMNEMNKNNQIDDDATIFVGKIIRSENN